MIIRVIAVDPQPQAGRSDLLVWQVPENSREFQVLTEALEQAGVEWTSVKATPKSKQREGK